MLHLVPLLLACSEEDPVEYEQINADDDLIEVQVGLSEEIDGLTVELSSNTGTFVVGTATIVPGGGPIGTVHTLTVVLTEPDLVNRVDRVSVFADSQGRTNEEFDLVADSADESFYQKELVTVGDEGEQRTDFLYLRVWDVVGDDDGAATTDDTGN